MIDDDGVDKGDPVPIQVKVTIAGSDMTIDLSGCSKERKAGVNSRTYAGARVAYKALTGPLEPVNEGSFRACKVVIPEGNIMMARYPAPMASWSSIVPTVVDCIVRALAPAMPDKVPAGHHGLLGGTVVFFGVDPTHQSALRHPEHRRRRLGRAAVRGRRIRHGVGLPGRRAQRSDRIDRTEMPGADRGARTAHAIPPAPENFAAGSASTCGCAISSKGRWNFDNTRRTQMSAVGPQRRQGCAYSDYLLKQPGENDFKVAHGTRRLVPAELRGHRAHRRRRRLGRSARARPGKGARRRDRGTWCRRASARDELWRRARRRTRGRFGKNAGAARVDARRQIQEHDGARSARRVSWRGQSAAASRATCRTSLRFMSSIRSRPGSRRRRPRKRAVSSSFRDEAATSVLPMRRSISSSIARVRAERSRRHPSCRR